MIEAGSFTFIINNVNPVTLDEFADNAFNFKEDYATVYVY